MGTSRVAGHKNSIIYSCPAVYHGYNDVLPQVTFPLMGVIKCLNQ